MHFPHTQTDIRVLLLLTEAMRKDFWNPTVYYECLHNLSVIFKNYENDVLTSP